MAPQSHLPTTFLPIESEAQVAGYHYIVGLDEAGRGPLAGPVVAAAVRLPVCSDLPGLQDSKRLTAQQREKVYACILEQALAYGIGVVSHTQIDQYNILWATQRAMIRAIQQLPGMPDLLLIDGIVGLGTVVSQRLIARGDAQCASIAAASVLAKVTRDRLMLGYSQRYPRYGFDQHKGYPTAKHYISIRRFGPCAIHRRSFRGVMRSGLGRGVEDEAVAVGAER